MKGKVSAALAVVILVAVVLLVWQQRGDDSHSGSAAVSRSTATGTAAVGDAPPNSANVSAASSARDIDTALGSGASSVAAEDSPSTVSTVVVVATPAAEETSPTIVIVRGRLLLPDGKPTPGVVSLVTTDFFAPTGYSGAGNAAVSVTTPLVSGMAGADGRFELRSPKAMPFHAVGSLEGYADAAEFITAETVTLARDGQGIWIAVKDLTLAEGVVVTGIVVDENESPIEGAALEAISTPSGWGASLVTRLNGLSGPDGRFTFDRIPRDGFTKVTATVEGRAPAQAGTANLTPKELKLVVSGTGSSVSGRVLNGTGKGVSGIRVYLTTALDPGWFNRDPIVREAVTDGDGVFSIHPVVSGNYHIAAMDGRRRAMGSKGNYAELITVSAPTPVEDVELTLIDGYTLRGVVVDGATKLGISGAIVYDANEGGIGLEEAQGSTAVTDANGQFTLREVFGQGDYSAGASARITARADGWFRISKRHDDSDAIPLTPAQRDYVVTIAMVRALEVTGVVVDDRGSPVHGAVVRPVPTTGEFTQSDEKGRFSIALPLSDKAQLSASLTGCPTSFSQPFVVPAEGVASPVTIMIDPGASVILRAVDEKGAPIPKATLGVMVRIYGEQWSSSSHDEQGAVNEKGEYRFDRLPTKDAAISIELNKVSVDFFGFAEGYIMDDEVRNVELAPREVKKLDIMLKPQDKSAWLAGIVVDQQDRPVTGASVEVRGKNSGTEKALSDKDGRYRVEGLPKEKLSVTVHHADYDSLHEYGVEPNDANRTLKMPADSVQVTIIATDAEGKPVPGVVALIAASDGNPRIQGVTKPGLPGVVDFPRIHRQMIESAVFRVEAHGFVPAAVSGLKPGEGSAPIIHSITMERYTGVMP